jgi:hypothetical protein
VTEETPETEHLHLTPEQKVALQEIIADRLWWDEALRRGRKFGIIIAAGAATLAFLAVWWPWITAMAQAILKDVPR